MFLQLGCNFLQKLSHDAVIGDCTNEPLTNGPYRVTKDPLILWTYWLHRQCQGPCELWNCQGSAQSFELTGSTDDDEDDVTCGAAKDQPDPLDLLAPQTIPR